MKKGEEDEKEGKKEEKEDEEEKSPSSAEKGYVAISLYYLDGPVNNVRLKAQVTVELNYLKLNELSPGHRYELWERKERKGGIQKKCRHFWKKVSLF